MLSVHPAPATYKAPKAVKLAEFVGNDELDAETWLFQAQQWFLLENINFLLHTRWVAQHLTEKAAAWWMDMITLGKS